MIIKCPTCSQEYEINQEMIGQPIQCIVEDCGTIFTPEIKKPKKNTSQRKKTDKSKEIIKAITDAQRIMKDCSDMDGNEAETRRRVERIFESVMGYDAFKHLSRERAVRGAGETEHVDFAIQLEPGPNATPLIMVELKRVNIKLSKKHLKQVSSYAINAGCEWILLTNGVEWQLHHVTFGQPPETKMLHIWNLLDDDPIYLAEMFTIIGLKNIKKGGLDTLWQKAHVLRPKSLLQAILSEKSINLLRRNLKSEHGVTLAPEEIIGAIRKLLNEASANIMDEIDILIPAKKK